VVFSPESLIIVRVTLLLLSTKVEDIEEAFQPRPAPPYLFYLDDFEGGTVSTATNAQGSTKDIVDEGSQAGFIPLDSPYFYDFVRRRRGVGSAVLTLLWWHGGIIAPTAEGSSLPWHKVAKR
jgi:hypothetical protein